MPMRGRRLWDQTYQLHYRTADAAQIEAVAAGAAGSSSAAASSSAPAPSASPLSELLKLRLPAELSVLDPCRQVLQLLQLLEALNRLGPKLLLAADEAQVSARETARCADWVSGVLSWRCY